VRARTIVALFVVLAVVAAGAAWWTLRVDRDEPSAATTSPSTEQSSDPASDPASGSAPPPPSGRPVAPCAPSEPSGGVDSIFWGMHVTSPIGDDFPDAPIGAVNLTTSQVYWNQVETSPGEYDFSRIDDIVATAEDRHAQPMLVLGFTPSFHATDPGSPTARATMPDATAWRDWVTAVVERYGDQLDYQVWPEPNIVGNWEGTPAQMARLSAVAGEIVHDEAPDALVVAPAVALRLEDQQRWMDRFWATKVSGSPVAESLDAVAVDPFPLEDGTPEDALDLLCRAEAILTDNGVDLPLWTNEINYGVPSGGGATDVQHYPDEQQAAFVARTYLLQAALGLDRVYWLGWGSYPGMAVELERDGTPTPAAQAYLAVRDWLAGRPRPVCRVDDGVHTCLVGGDEEVVRILWRERGTSSVSAGDRATRLETLGGAHRKLRAGDEVRVGQAPVAVVEAEAS